MFVAGAAAKIARQPSADIIVRGERIFAQKISRSHKHARGAEPALQRVMRVKRFLQRVHLPDATEALDRFDAAAVGLHRKHQAGTRAVAVYQYRTRAADAVLTTDMGAGEAQRVTQKIGKEEPRLDDGFVDGAVHGHGDLARLFHVALLSGVPALPGSRKRAAGEHAGQMPPVTG